MHWVIDELPGVDDVDVGQVEQALSDVVPAVVPYLPAPQSLQASAPLLEYFPLGHVEHAPSPRKSLPFALNLPAAHGKGSPHCR